MSAYITDTLGYAIAQAVSCRRRNVSPVRYELGFYMPEDGILLTRQSFD
jgi:hypothetical protein